MNNQKTKMIARSGIIAALYVVLTFAVLPLASGAIQFRVSEALTLLPIFYVEAIPALFVGCLLSNIISGCAIYDIIFGSLVTLVASLCTYFGAKLVKNHILKVVIGGLFPTFFNAFLLPIIWYFAYGQLEYVYMMQVGFLILSQAVVIYGLGSLLYFAIIKLQAKGVKVFCSYTQQKVVTNASISESKSDNNSTGENTEYK